MTIKDLLYYAIVSAIILLGTAFYLFVTIGAGVALGTLFGLSVLGSISIGIGISGWVLLIILFVVLDN